MPTDRTRTAILEAAERLYADRGFADVTLRDIVAAAGVNLAAVNYHFGSKDELIAGLFVTRSLALNRERLAELPSLAAIKIAPFSRYRTLDVVRAVCESSRADQIALYTCPHLWSHDMPRDLEHVHYASPQTLLASNPTVVATARAHANEIAPQLGGFRRVDSVKMIGKWFDVYRR